MQQILTDLAQGLMAWFYRLMRYIFLFLLLAGCGQTAIPDEFKIDPTQPFGWLEGCWRTLDGSVTERWTLEGDGYLFGSSITRKDDKVVFFEQMRIEPSENGPVLNAYPNGEGPSPFYFLKVGEQSVTFTNAEHDYPQMITYEHEDDFLICTISLIDGTNTNKWIYKRCEK